MTAPESDRYGAAAARRRGRLARLPAALWSRAAALARAALVDAPRGIARALLAGQHRSAEYLTIKTSGQFDAAFYRAQKPDVAGRASDPVADYIVYGAKEGRDPSAQFSTAAYLRDHPDLLPAGINPLAHKLGAGARAGIALRTLLADVPDDAAGLAPLGFSPCAAPVLSIIVPVYDGWRQTYACLRALALRTPASLRFEIIVADDASRDETRDMLAAMPGLRVLRNATNLGFLRNCNRAAAAARGEFLCFLNNDTEVQYGWAEALLDVFARHPRAGLAAGKLVYPDGRVQEAGGIIWRDGWGHSFGRGLKAGHPECNYVKTVDCAVGACLMMRRRVFLDLGGFDDSFAPAFYEEFDLQFALRAAGLDTVYQPRAVILHHGSASYGVEARDRHSLVNHDRFVAKWPGILAGQFPRRTEMFLARDRSGGKKHILVIENRVPEPDKHAGALTVFQYVELLLAEGFAVSYLPHDRVRREPYTGRLQQMGVEVLYTGVKFGRWLRRNGRHLDFAFVCRPDVAVHYLGLLRRHTRARLLYYTHDLHHLRLERQYAQEGHMWQLAAARLFRRLEYRVFRRVDCIMSPSADEAKTIRAIAPGRDVVTLPPYFYDFDAPPGDRPGFAARSAFMFLGGFDHPPNVDAVEWFAGEIFPRIRAALPDAEFRIVGSNPPARIRALQGNGITLVGYVADLAPEFDRARVFVAPLRYGAGVKGKIVTSIVQGVPVVSTAIGNEGLDLVDGESALLANDAATFAAAALAAHADAALWQRLAEGARAHVRRRLSRAAAVQALYEAMGDATPPAAMPTPGPPAAI